VSASFPILQTKRLNILCLSREQLEAYQIEPEQLERELDISLSRPIMTFITRRAIAKKLRRMQLVPPDRHPWYTYWLIELNLKRFGAGLAGFKGRPDEMGQVEIGYVIDPGFRNQGFMTEAVRSLIDWAFKEPTCKAVIAPNTLKSNLASNRVLEKAGMTVYAQDETSLSWQIEKSCNDIAKPGYISESGERD
jgi:ribosomal-protein-alanine N-acetyltransferase